MTLVVSSASISQSVRLERFIGAIEVNLTDPIRIDASKITLTLVNEAYAFRLNDMTPISVSINPTSVTKTFTLISTDKGAINKKFLIHAANTNTAALNLTIRAYDANNMLIAEKGINNISTYINKRTILSGPLFSSNSTNVSFTYTVNPTWDTDVPIRTF